MRRDLCLSQYLDTYIFNLPHVATDCCMELYYICAFSVQEKQKVLGFLMECSGARQEWLLACLPTSVNQQHTPTTINPWQQREREREGERQEGSLAKGDQLVLTSYKKPHPRVYRSQNCSAKTLHHCHQVIYPAQYPE